MTYEHCRGDGPRSSALGLSVTLLGLINRRRCHLPHDSSEDFFVSVSAVLARRIDELLSLALAGVGCRLALRHGASGSAPSIGDLLACRDPATRVAGARHG